MSDKKDMPLLLTSEKCQDKRAFLFIIKHLLKCSRILCNSQIAHSQHLLKYPFTTPRPRGEAPGCRKGPHIPPAKVTPRSPSQQGSVQSSAHLEHSCSSSICGGREGRYLYPRTICREKSHSSAHRFGTCLNYL